MTCRYCDQPSIGQEVDHSDGYRFPVCAMCAHVNATVHLHNNNNTLRFNTIRVGMPAFMVRMTDPYGRRPMTEDGRPWDQDDPDGWQANPILGSVQILKIEWRSAGMSAYVHYHRAGVTTYVDWRGDTQPVPGTKVWIRLPDLDRARRQAHR